MCKIKMLFIAFVTMLPLAALPQAGSAIKITEAQQGGALLDSITSREYPYVFPLLGKKAAAKGFMLPYPLGVMVNSFLGRQDVTISDLSVYINDASGNSVVPDISLDELVRFGDVTANVYNVNARVDLWVLPFLDLYGIVGGAWLTTDVNIASIAGKAVDISTQAKFNGYVYGTGAMLTGGIRNYFLSADFNTVWTHFDELKNNNYAMNFSLRAGYVVHFKKPERNIALWLGASRAFLNNTTSGTLSLSDVAPEFGEAYKTSDWYMALTQPQKALIDRTVENFTDKHKGDVIGYSLEKRPSHNWCMVVGAQYQLSRRWQFRTEANLLGGRTSALLSANYRFGIK